MGKSLAAIYEGDGVLRLLDAPPELKAQQLIQIEIVESLSLFMDDDWDDEIFAPSAEAVWADMGLVEIADAALARWLAESDDLTEWNLFLNAEPR